MAVKPVPDRYHTVTPYLTVQGVPKLIDFVKRVFDATELERMSRIGAIAPDLWMQEATGSPISAEPLLRATTAALQH